MTKSIILKLIMLVLPVVICLIVGKSSVSVVIAQPFQASKNLEWAIDKIEISHKCLSVEGYLYFVGDSQWFGSDEKHVILKSDSGETMQLATSSTYYDPSMGEISGVNYSYCGFLSRVNLEGYLNNNSTYSVYLSYRYADAVYEVDTGYVIRDGEVFARYDRN